jgi:hypothetical protein
MHNLNYRSIIITMLLITCPFISAMRADRRIVLHGARHDFIAANIAKAKTCGVCHVKGDGFHLMTCCNRHICQACIRGHLKVVAQNKKLLKCALNCGVDFTVESIKQFNHDAPDLVKVITSYLNSYTERVAPRDVTQNPYNETNRDCPQCGVVIERNHGCQHMTCSNCTYEFCWICLKKYGICGPYLCKGTSVPFDRAPNVGRQPNIIETIMPILKPALGIGFVLGLAHKLFSKNNLKKQDQTVAPKQSWFAEKYTQLKKSTVESYTAVKNQYTQLKNKAIDTSIAVKDSIKNGAARTKNFVLDKKDVKSKVARQALVGIGTYALLQQYGTRLNVPLSRTMFKLFGQKLYGKMANSFVYPIRRQWANGRLPNIGAAIGTSFLAEIWYQKK